MSYVYIKSESKVWTVGFFDPRGEFIAESDHGEQNLAAAWTHFLNGGDKVYSMPVRDSDGDEK